ncbi:hypothetical protein SCHPADRAFT_902182 [Schizopora paradoxa]|uniref:Uncharacterized protein n=1 Tax=Schizopora paradoxa TaxID=27342 RepID=A0A0H2RUG9_9AGAM|nr:hypothetical protein SCHPADRAFT_902182 [Schizopora paradoxa]
MTELVPVKIVMKLFFNFVSPYVILTLAHRRLGDKPASVNSFKSKAWLWALGANEETCSCR